MRKYLLYLLILGLLIGSVLPLAQPVHADTSKLLGTNAAGGSNVSTGYVLGSQFTCNVTGVLSEIKVFCNVNSFARVAIYSDSGVDTVGNLLAESASQEVVQTYWNTIALGSTVNITAGTKYFLLTQVTFAGGVAYGLEVGRVRGYKVQAYGAFPATGAGFSHDTGYDYSIQGWGTALTVPTVTTSTTDNISCEAATLNGEITNTGGLTVDYYAFVWDTSSHGDPGDAEPPATYSDNWTSPEGNYTVDDYSHNLDSLNVDDTYHVRFAAHNSEGWSYGDEVDFDTLAIPTIILQSATDITVSSARLQSYLDDDGGQACQVRFGWGEVDQSDNITAYEHYSVYAGSYTTGQSPYLNIDTLDARTTYYFNVEAYGAGCDTDTGVSDNFTTESSVGSPSNVIAIPDIDNVTLSWVKGIGAPNTFIRFKMNTCPADETDGTLIYMSTASTYTHEGLESGADYCYYLVSYDSVEGYSSGHVTIHATTLAAGLPADTEGEAIDKPTGGMTSSPAVSATLIDKIPILVFTQKDAAAIGMPHANFLYIIMLLGMMGLSYAVYRWTHEPMVIVAIWLIGVAWIARPILGVPLVVPIFITIVGAGYSVYRLRAVV